MQLICVYFGINFTQVMTGLKWMWAGHLKTGGWIVKWKQEIYVATRLFVVKWFLLLIGNQSVTKIIWQENIIGYRNIVMLYYNGMSPLLQV